LERVDWLQRTSGGTLLTAIVAITLGLCLLGLAYSVWLAARLSTAATGLALLFGFAAARQVFVLYEGSLPAWEPSATAFAELAVMGIALGGLAALRALRRTTRERDRVEDLHWDSMEAVRVMSEVAARPGADLGQKVGTVLQHGAVRFGLELGIAWCERDGGEIEVIGVHAPDAEQQQSLLAELRPRLEDASRGTRAQVVVERGAEPRVFFGTRIAIGDGGHGVLAFAGSRDPEERLTATDKDLLGLMAQWLGAELERRARPAARAVADAEHEVADAEHEVAHAPPVARIAPLRPRRGRDLNAAVRRAEGALRRRVGTDATLELALDPQLPKVRAGRLSLATIVESAVLTAARLAPTGRIRVETRAPEEEAADLLLCVQASGDVDAGALQRLFDEAPDAETPRGGLPFSRLERLLRSDGGDLSVSIEPGERAVLTAYLPAAPPTPRDRERARPAAAQPSR